MPAKSFEKQNPDSHFDVNLQEIIGHTKSVIVVPQSNRLTTACDCCIRQYCLITHIRKNDPFFLGSDMVSVNPRAVPSRTPPPNWVMMF